jgi:hypothetical protein
VKTLINNVTRLGVVLIALALIVGFSGFAITTSAQSSTETDFMTILNSQRISLGENSLAISSSLSSAAYLHSKDMAENNYFSHTSADGRTFDQRIIAAGYTSWTGLSENIAYYYGQPDAATIYNMWKNSPGHYANMTGDYTDAGLGVYTLNNYTFCTLDLGKNGSSVPPPAPDFALSASPGVLNVTPGASTTSAIKITSISGFSGIVALTASPLPTGWTLTLAPASPAIASGGSGSSLLSITAPSTASTGSFNFSVTGVNGAKSRNTTLTVNTQGVKTAPSAPQYLKATAGNAQVALNWSAPSNIGTSAISNYRVYRRTTTTSATLLVTLGNVLSYKDATALNGNTYYYLVTAVNPVGESPKSNEASATLAAPAVKVLNVAVRTNYSTYSRGNYGTSGYAVVTATDGSTGSQITGVSITLNLYYPNGALARTIYSTISSRGTSPVYFNLRSSDPPGVYGIKVSASKTGYLSGTGQAIFTVK